LTVSNLPLSCPGGCPAQKTGGSVLREDEETQSVYRPEGSLPTPTDERGAKGALRTQVRSYSFYQLFRACMRKIQKLL